MKQTSRTITAKQEDIFAIAGDHFVNINKKIKKSDVSTSLTDGVLPLGTLISSDGKVATSTSSTTDAVGILVNSIDFDGINNSEYVTASVCIHGFVKEDMVKFNSTADIATVEKAALNMIKFL